MQITFLSPDHLQKPLTLEPKEDTLYFLSEGSEENTISLNLTTPGVRAFLVGLFRTESKQDFFIHQNHSAPRTVSHVLLKTALHAEGKFFYQGTLHIEKEATGTIASQEARGLLLGDQTQFKVIPSLEILPKDVKCTHKASAAPISRHSLFTLETRGLSEEESRALLEDAFLSSAFDVLADLGVSESDLNRIQEKYQ